MYGRNPAGAYVSWRLIAVCVILGAQAAIASGPSTADARKGDGSDAKFFNLRYDEDFRYFDDNPEDYAGDFRNRLKNIHVGDDWRVDVGGEFRFRLEARSNPRFGNDVRTENTQQNYRWMLHTNVRYRDLFRVFVQGIVTHVEDQDGPFQPTLENHGDLQQLFFDLRVFGESTPVTLRVGRQELDYGANRWVGPLEWVSNRRRFDAVKLFYEGDEWKLDAFYAKPVVVQRKQSDRLNEQLDFYSLYATYKGIKNHGWDIYAFGLDQTQEATNPNGKTGNQSVYTVGSRFWGHTPAVGGDADTNMLSSSCPTCGSGGPGTFDYNAELAGQWGTFAHDTVQAWSWNIDVGYTFAHPWRPRVGAGFDWVSGDEEPLDGKVGTFNQLFPFNNVCIGYIDLIGRQNMNMAYVGLDAWPIADKVKTGVTFHSFWLNADRDSLYNAGAIPTLRDPLGHSGTEVGQELDLSVEWVISKYSSAWFAYSYFWAGPFVHETQRFDDNPQLFIIQYQYKF